MRRELVHEVEGQLTRRCEGIALPTVRPGSMNKLETDRERERERERDQLRDLQWDMPSNEEEEEDTCDTWRIHHENEEEDAFIGKFRDHLWDMPWKEFKAVAAVNEVRGGGGGGERARARERERARERGSFIRNFP